MSICVSASDQQKRANTLVTHGWTHALFVVLVYESKEDDCSEELLISIHQVLAKLTSKGTCTYMYMHVDMYVRTCTYRPHSRSV